MLGLWYIIVIFDFVRRFWFLIFGICFLSAWWFGLFDIAVGIDDSTHKKVIEYVQTLPEQKQMEIFKSCYKSYDLKCEQTIIEYRKLHS